MAWRARIVGGLLGVCALAVAGGCASTEQPEPRGPVVVDLEIRGTKAISARTLKKRLATVETGWWPFARKRRFDEIEWQADLLRIERFYETQGYYQARVTNAQVLAARGDPEDAVELLVEVEENLPVLIDAVDVRGLDALPAQVRDQTLDGLPLARADIFLEERWEEGKRLILQHLRDWGYAAAELIGEARVSPSEQRAALDLLVAPGRRYRFGEVQVNTRAGASVAPYLVREQVELALDRDRTYSDADLVEAQRRVFGMGVFGAARVSAGRPDAKSGQVPIVVDVGEAPFRTVRLGGGVAFDQVRQEARLRASWSHRNFLGGLRRLSLEAVAGWTFIPSFLAVAREESDEAIRHGPIYRATASFERPRLFGRPTLKLTSLLESGRTLEPAYSALGGGGSLGVTWQPSTTLSLAPTYNLQGFRLDGPAEASALTAPLALGCATDPCFVLLSYLEQIVTWDRRDHPLEPRHGFLLSLSLQEGGGPLGGDFGYLRVVPDVRGYVTPGHDGRFTLAARLRVGVLAPSSGRSADSPAVVRLYAGGPNSMRGFGLRRLAPLVLLPLDVTQPESKVAVPIGGNGLVEGSLEARMRVGENLLLAIFTDFGMVTTDPTPLEALGSLLWAVGLGFRYLSPVGPIRIDFGFRIPVGRPPPLFDENGVQITYRRLPGGGVQPGAESGANTDRSCLGIGPRAASWVHDGLCAVHVSIGEAF